MKITIGSDHAGLDLKKEVINYLYDNHLIVDVGTHSSDSCDYPDYGHLVAESVTNKECDFGIVICGSGNGINMTVNKWPDVRAALCWESEIAYMARLHNDANILTLPGRYISLEEAIKCVEHFITVGFEGGRHSKRVDKIQLK